MRATTRCVPVLVRATRRVPCNTLTRRQLLQSGGAAGAAIVLARAPFTWAAGNAPLPKFADALPTPGAGWGVLDLRAAPSATLTVSQFAAPVHSSLPPTAVWGYGSEASSTYLGPTIVATKDKAMQDKILMMVGAAQTASKAMAPPPMPAKVQKTGGPPPKLAK